MKPQRSYPGKGAFVIANPKSPLMDQIREVLRVRHYILRTEEAYTGWALRFLKFHRDQSGEWKHPRDLGAAEVVGFLNHLASAKAVSASTQNQALNAIVFLYSQVLGVELYGTGMRLMEVLRLRVKDVDFDRGQIMVRGGKGIRIG